MKVGEKKNLLTMISEPWVEIDKKGRRRKFSKFLCECGKEINIILDNVKRGASKSCGCLRSKVSKETRQKMSTKGGISKHKFYNTYYRIQKTSKLTGCGICEAWLDFYKFVEWAEENFIEGYVIHKADIDKPFSPENCEFVKMGQFPNRPRNKEKFKKTCLEKYGVESPNQSEEVKAKIRKTCLEKYGVEHYWQSKENWKKQEEKNIERWGVKSSLMLDEIKEKSKQTIINKYGVDHVSKAAEIKEKIKNTCLNRYDTESVFSNKEIREKINKTIKEKYGVECVAHIPGIQEKIKKTIIEKYDGKLPGPNGKEEQSLLNYISAFGEFKTDRRILNGKEIDLYCKDLKIGIEYNGLRWHHSGSRSNRGRSYHYNKYKNCADKGIKLITIWSDEWRKRTIQVKNYLFYIFSQETSIVDNCKIKEISNDIAKEFINLYHIKTIDKIKFSIGIYLKNELIGCVAFKKHKRISGLILSRFCFKHGHKISCEKEIIALAKKKNKELGFNKITAWSDNRWAEEEIYNKMGFNIICDLKADYEYVNIGKPECRYSKNDLKQIYENITDNYEELGYSKLWDCGKKRWELDT